MIVDPPVKGRTRNLHLDPYWLGDSLRALYIALHRGRLFIDQNGQLTGPALNGHRRIVITHWHEILRNGWRFIAAVDSQGRIVHDKHGREVRERLDIARSTKHWELSPGATLRLRQTKREGRSYRSKIGPQYAETHARLAHKLHGARLTIELKSPLFAEHDGLVALQDLRKNLARTSTTQPIIMTLENMRGAEGKLANADAAGFQTRLLPRGPRPSYWGRLVRLGTRAWGRFTR